jgi:dihydrofolate reductase
VRKLIMWNLVTLDGYFEGVTPWDLEWHALGWGDELDRFSLEQLRAADMLVFGRITYAGMAAYWQSAEGEIADLMNRLPKVVVSRTQDVPVWNNTTLVSDHVVESLTALKQAGDGPMFVFGSANLASTLITANLFDEYRLAIAPVFLGAGRPLFHAGFKQQRLILLESRPLTTGCVVLRYAPVSAHAAAGEL